MFKVFLVFSFKPLTSRDIFWPFDPLHRTNTGFLYTYYFDAPYVLVGDMDERCIIDQWYEFRI